MESSASYCTRPVRVGPLRVRLCSDQPAVIARFDRLFSGFEDAESGASADGREVELTVTGEFESTVDGAQLRAFGELGDHELDITRLLNDRKLDAEPELLHLHAGAVALDGLAVVLAAMSGSGKTTLAAALVQRGWGYVTDEQVALRPGDSALFAYPRPLTVRRVVWPLFADVAEVPSQQPDDLDDARVEVSPAAFGAVHGGPSRPIAVVVPRFDAGAVTELTRFASAAEVVEHLASCCYDLERLGLPGMELLVSIAANCPAWHLRYAGLDEAAQCVSELYSAATTCEPYQVRHIAPTSDKSPLGDGMVRRGRTAHAWAFADGSTVVYDPPTRTITRLDAAGTALWDALHDAHAAEEVVESLRGDSDAAEYGIRSWLHTMLVAGLLVEQDDG